MTKPTATRSAELALRAWFITVFVLFFGRGLMYTAWATRGPDIREYLNVSLADMGFLAMLFSVGAIAGVVLTGPIINRFGSRVVAVFSFTAMPTFLALMAILAVNGQTGWVMFVAVLFGFPFGAADFASNVEASDLDRQSAKSRMPLLHGGYSIGVLLGAASTGLLISAGVSTIVHLIGIAVIVGSLALWRASLLPKDNGKQPGHAEPAAKKVKDTTPVNYVRVIKISSIAFIFVLAEGAAAVFIPLALVDAGRSSASAAFTYTLFSLGMAFMRIVGGWIVDRIGRQRVVLYSSIVAAVGIGLFVFTPSAPVEHIAALLWGAGNSLAIAMTVSAITDNPVTANRLQSILWTFVYFGNLGVGPLLGGIANLTGIFLAFLLPVALMIVSAIISPALRKDSSGESQSASAGASA